MSSVAVGSLASAESKRVLRGNNNTRTNRWRVQEDGARKLCWIIRYASVRRDCRLIVSSVNVERVVFLAARAGCVSVLFTLGTNLAWRWLT